MLELSVVLAMLMTADVPSGDKNIVTTSVATSKPANLTFPLSACEQCSPAEWFNVFYRSSAELPRGTLLLEKAYSLESFKKVSLLDVIIQPTYAPPWCKNPKWLLHLGRQAALCYLSHEDIMFFGGSLLLDVRLAPGKKLVFANPQENPLASCIFKFQEVPLTRVAEHEPCLMSIDFKSAIIGKLPVVHVSDDKEQMKPTCYMVHVFDVQNKGNKNSAIK